MRRNFHRALISLKLEILRFGLFISRNYRGVEHCMNSRSDFRQSAFFREGTLHFIPGGTGYVNANRSCRLLEGFSLYVEEKARPTVPALYLTSGPKGRCGPLITVHLARHDARHADKSRRFTT